MSEHSLPDDISRWPNNPWVLLGVSPGVSQRELRRAYAGLVRAYKPEHFPEHFRRIREAYENLLRYAAFTPEPEAPGEAAAQTVDDPHDARPLANGQAHSADMPATERSPSPPLRTLEDELDEAWDWAIDGAADRAYARLLELLDRNPRQSEICVRLYSLLRGFPELDAQRAPCDFLAQGVREAHGGGPCHELYRREIEQCPAEALSDRFNKLLQSLVGTAQPGLLSAIIEWRWTAASTLRKYDLIRQDLSRLCPQLAAEHEEFWLRLLASAAEQFAWAPNLQYMRECLREARENQHLQLPCADVFDRLELLEHLATGLRHVQDLCAAPEQFLELLRRSRLRPIAEIRQDATAQFARIVDRPDHWLAVFDSIQAISPLVLSLVGALLDLYEWSRDYEPDDRGPAELSALAQRFLIEFGQLGYTKLRPRLLKFCLREFVHPNAVAEAAVTKQVHLPPARVDKLVSDWPLRHVFRACILFWREC
jgi:hypothetical protein